MSGSIWGNQFCVSTWGESHGKGIGAVIDGCPAGLALSEKDLQIYLDRRKPGTSRYTTARRESDKAVILSGVFEGYTTGTPISVMIPNEDQHSSDYSAIKDIFRPGHADYTYDRKYGIRDYRGGGRSSGRETIGRVIGGAVAAKLLKEFGISVTAYAASIGPVSVDPSQMDLSCIRSNALQMPMEDISAAEEYLHTCIQNQDSAGGVVECIVDGCPAGLGDPVFRKLDAVIAGAVMSIGAVKGVEIGDGFLSSKARGSENNDPFINEDGHIQKASNHSGGILGGISDGSPILVRAAIKPTPSVSLPQQTVNTDGEPATIRIQGRHDPCIVPRAVVVVEAMTALAVADALLSNATSRLDSLKKVYS